MRVGLIAALASAAVCTCGALGSAQTAPAPTPVPVGAPTAAPVPLPVGSAAPAAPPTYAPAVTPAGAKPPAALPIPAGGPLALDARYLRAVRAGTGYALTGQALVKDACTDARFARVFANVFPPLFNVVQYRRPGTAGLLCIARLTWVTIKPLSVTGSAPRYVNVRTQKRLARVVVLPGVLPR